MKFKLPVLRLPLFKLPKEAFDKEPPPILGNWPTVYAAVLGWLAFTIGICYAFTRYFS